MAAGDARPIPHKNVAYRYTFFLLDADGDPISGVGFDSGLASGTSKAAMSKDGGALVNSTNNITETPASSGVYVLDFTSAEMGFDTVVALARPNAAGIAAGVKTTPIILNPEEAGDIRATAILGTNAITDTTLDSTVGAEIAAAVWAAATRTLSSGANIVLAKGTGITGFNDIAALAVWDVLESAVVAVNTMGLKVKTNLDAAVSSRALEAGGNVAGIRAKTDVITFNETDVNVNVQQWSGDPVEAPHNAGCPKVTLKTGTTAGLVGLSGGVIDANVELWKDAVASGSAGFPQATLKSGAAAGEVNTSGGSVEARIVGMEAGGDADVSAAVDVSLNTAIPGSPAANSIFERIKALDDAYTAARAPLLDNLDAMVSTRATPAQVDAEMRDVLTTETLVSPVQAAPSAAPTVTQALAILYFYLRNKVTNDGTTLKVFGDDENTVLWKRPVSEVAGLFTRGEGITGP